MFDHFDSDKWALDQSDWSRGPFSKKDRSLVKDGPFSTLNLFVVVSIQPWSCTTRRSTPASRFGTGREPRSMICRAAPTRRACIRRRMPCWEASALMRGNSSTRRCKMPPVLTPHPHLAFSSPKLSTLNHSPSVHAPSLFISRNWKRSCSSFAFAQNLCSRAGALSAPLLGQSLCGSDTMYLRHGRGYMVAMSD